MGTQPKVAGSSPVVRTNSLLTCCLNCVRPRFDSEILHNYLIRKVSPFKMNPRSLTEHGRSNGVFLALIAQE